METGLRGKNALITGGSSGIGRGIAEVLASEKVNLAIASRHPDSEVIAGFAARGVDTYTIRADVSREEEVVRMVEEAVAMLGHIDLYINNAAWVWHQPVTKIDSDLWYRTLNTNLSSCVWACREVCKHMIQRNRGSILIVGSTVRFNPAYGESAYRISKMGLFMYMQNLALEMAPYGIRVNMVTPGHFQTRMTANIAEETERRLRDKVPARRFGNPAEVGHAAALLLSDQLSGYTYGADLVIDGGLSLNPLMGYPDDDMEMRNGEGGRASDERRKL